MKKKDVPNKAIKIKSTNIAPKKGSVKSKAKVKLHKPQQSILILLGDNVYVASSKSQRKTYNQYQKRAKTSTNYTHKLPSRSNHQQNQSLNLQEYVKSLSKAEKQKLLMDLSKQIEGQKCEEVMEVQDKEDKLQRLNSKLQGIRIQLIARWETQINQINHLFENQQISLEDKNQKIILVEKIRNSKLTMIEYTRVLFQKILKEQGQLQLNKQQHIQQIINSLNSNSSLDSLSEQIGRIENSRQIELTETMQKKEDQTENCKEEPKTVQKLQISSQTSQELKATFILQHDDSNKCFIRKGEDQFVLGQPNRIIIPLLMTKDKLQQLQLQKVTQQIEGLNLAIRNRSQFQHSEIIPENQQHFTTIMDINQFVISFYEFVVNNYIREVIEWINIPYGKSCLDKLFAIRTEGRVPSYELSSVLHRDFLDMYHNEIDESVRKVSEYEKSHNLAIFDAFNSGLNSYRAYYDLEGEVFPWNTSERGLTFYEISEDNIEEVFEKTKMKILEGCTVLCGLMPECELTTQEAKRLITKKHQQTYERVVQSQTKENFGEWNVQVLNFQALVRLNVSEQIFLEELTLAIEQLRQLGQV